MSKWQASEEQARAAMESYYTVTVRSEDDECKAFRAAITAAIGDEVDELRGALRILVEVIDEGKAFEGADIEPYEQRAEAALDVARAVLAKTGGGR